jgi:hypothetical protein
MQEMQEWEKQDFHGALRKMMCPSCGATMEHNHFTFQCKESKIQIGQSAGNNQYGYNYDPYNNQRPNHHVDQVSIDRNSTVECGVCRMAFSLDEYYLTFENILETQFFHMTFNMTGGPNNIVLQQLYKLVQAQRGHRPSWGTEFALEVLEWPPSQTGFSSY